MFLFLDISGGEFLLVVLAGMLLFGKDRLPGIVRGVIRGVEYVRKTSQEVKEQIHAETGLQDTVTRMRDEAENIVQDIRQEVQSVAREGEELVSSTTGAESEGRQEKVSADPAADSMLSADADRTSVARAGRTNPQSTDHHVADA